MPKKIEDNSKIEILQAGIKTPFWDLVVEAIKESKQHIQDQMDSDDLKELTAEQYKFQNEIFKTKKQFLDMLIRTPNNIISWMEKPTKDKPRNFDPYGDE